MTVLIRPPTLNPPQQYLLRLPHTATEPSYLPVRFISYQPCPALVVVSLLQSDGSTLRVARDDIFIEMNGSGMSVQSA